MTKSKDQKIAPPPKDFPEFAFVGLQVPYAFNKVIIATAAKTGLIYEDQLLDWAMKGAECERMHKGK